jgi:hypothetical protein
LIGTEVQLQFAAVVRWHDVAVRAESGLLRIKRRFSIDEFIEPRDVLFTRDSPDPRRCRCRNQRDAGRQRTKEQIVIDKVAFVRIEMIMEPALVAHHA